jgi:hypothetical protein
MPNPYQQKQLPSNSKPFIRICFGVAGIYLLLISAGATFSQTDLLARKFDEFGDIQASDLIARLDNLAIQLQNEPNTKAFLIVYRTRRDLPGLSNRYAHRMKNYLVDSRGIAAERTITVDGGIADCLTQELWIAPPGTTPKPRSDAYLEFYRPDVFKFDEHPYAVRKDVEVSYWQHPPKYLLGYLEAFALELQRNRSSIGYLVGYRGQGRDGPRLVQKILRTERLFLIREFGIRSNRLKPIVGGYREAQTVELWIGKKGGSGPIITSYRYPRG